MDCYNNKAPQTPKNPHLTFTITILNHPLTLHMPTPYINTTISIHPINYLVVTISPT